MDEYICMTVLSRSGESQAEFSARLSRLWTRMLREKPDEFERVYAETTEFEDAGGRWSRQYLVGVEVTPAVEAALRSADVEFEPVDLDELFSKYEAVSPEWMQIEH